MLATAPAVAAACAALPIVVVAAHAGRFASFFVLIGVSIATASAVVIRLLRNSPASRRLSTGLVLAALVLVTVAPRARHLFEERAYPSLPYGSVVTVEGRIIDDLRPGASQWQHLAVEPIYVRNAERWRGSAEGRLSVIWEGSPYLVDADQTSTLPVRGDTLLITGCSGLPSGEETTLFVEPSDLRLVRRLGLVEVRRRVRRAVRVRLGRLSRSARGLAGALLLGERGDLPSTFLDLVKRAGASHVLALSGMHLAVLAGVLSVVVAPVVPRRFRTLILLPVLFGYVWIAGWIPSLVRALILLCCATLPRIRGRRVPSPLLLARTVLVSIVVAPRLVVEVGFLLSVGALLGLTLWTRPFASRFSLVLPEPLALYVGGSAAALLGTGPISLTLFGALYPAGLIFAGIFSALVVGVVWLVLLFLVVARVPVVGTVFIGVLEHATLVIEALARVGARIPPATGAAGVVVLVLLALLVLPSRRRRTAALHEPRLDF